MMVYASIHISLRVRFIPVYESSVNFNISMKLNIDDKFVSVDNMIVLILVINLIMERDCSWVSNKELAVRHEECNKNDDVS